MIGEVHVISVAKKDLLKWLAKKDGTEDLQQVVLAGKYTDDELAVMRGFFERYLITDEKREVKRRLANAH